MDPRRARSPSVRTPEPGARRLSREAALQMLYGLDAPSFGADEGEAQIRAYWEHVDEVTRAEGRAYADELVRGVCEVREELDDVLRAAQTKWRIERMSRVDRSILRIATWELRRGEVPAEVVINEAIELAKLFGSEDSSAFVNGLVERVAVRLGRLQR